MNKRIIKKTSMVLITFILVTPIAYADTAGFCSFNEIRRILKIIGWIILLIKIAVPLLLIIYTMLDLIKAMTAKDEIEYKKMPKIILKRVIAVILVFLVPTFINIVLNIADDGKINDSASACKACINSPSNCKVTKSSYVPARPKMDYSRSTSSDTTFKSIGYNWKWSNNKLVYVDKLGNVIKNKKFTVNGVTYRALSDGKVMPNVDKPNTTTSLSTQTAAIVNAHRYDFTVDNFNEVMKKYGGYKKYIKSLGGVFTKYADFKGKIKTVKELQEVTEYVTGVITIWGFDYANWQPSHYGKWGGNGSPASDAFYPGSRNNGKKENWTSTGIDTVASGGGNGMTVHCNLGVDYILRKSGLMKANDPASYYDAIKKVGKKKITNSRELKPGDIINYFDSSGTNYHTNMVIERDDKKGTFTMVDTGHYLSNSAGTYKRTRKLGESPISGRSWIAYRVFDLK